MEIGKLIGKGKTAEVYEVLNMDQMVLKLFYETIPSKTINQEFEVSKHISRLGISTPIAFNLIKVNERYGIVYEHITGKSLTNIISSKPLHIKDAAQIFAELQASYHQVSSNKLPSQKECLLESISRVDLLDEAEKKWILLHLNKLTDDNKLCHGDYHPDNIIVSDGKPIILDWLTGSAGNPCGDVARTLILLNYSYLPLHIPFASRIMLQIVRKMFANIYVKAYLEQTNAFPKKINDWMLPIMAARLGESIPKQEKQILLAKIRAEKRVSRSFL